MHADSLAVEQVATGSLGLDPAIPRRVIDVELEALTPSLARFGFVQPVLARRERRRRVSRGSARS